MPESFVELLISVAFGALLGFLASIGYSFIQERMKKKGFRIRLRQEFELIRGEIQRDMDKGKIVARGFPRYYYQSHAKELVEMVDANTWQRIVEADSAIHDLGTPDNIQERYTNALKLLDNVIRQLK